MAVEVVTFTESTPSAMNPGLSEPSKKRSNLEPESEPAIESPSPEGVSNPSGEGQATRKGFETRTPLSSMGQGNSSPRQRVHCGSSVLFHCGGRFLHRRTQRFQRDTGVTLEPEIRRIHGRLKPWGGRATPTAIGSKLDKLSNQRSKSHGDPLGNDFPSRKCAFLPKTP